MNSPNYTLPSLDWYVFFHNLQVFVLCVYSTNDQLGGDLERVYVQHKPFERQTTDFSSLSFQFNCYQLDSFIVPV